MLNFSFVTEIILATVAIIWGTILLLPGNLFSNPSRIDLLDQYAPDWLFGLLMCTFGVVLLAYYRNRFHKARKFAHQALSIIWFGIVILAIYRTAENGISPVDILITSLFVVMPLLHTTLYLYWGSIRRDRIALGHYDET